MRIANPKLHTISFDDGMIERHEVNIVGGGCMAGQPTAYVKRNDVLVWVRRIQQCHWNVLQFEFVEAS